MFKKAHVIFHRSMFCSKCDALLSYRANLISLPWPVVTGAELFKEVQSLNLSKVTGGVRKGIKL